jgi:hypothetical protein
MLLNFRKFSAALLLGLAVLVTQSAQAGRSCEIKPVTVQGIARGLRMAEQTYNRLEASGNKVVLLARAGQDLTKYRLRYSHLGFAYQEPDGAGGHVWRVLHKLNQCGTAEAAIYRQGLGEFFLDDPWRYEAAFVAPTAEVQERLLAMLLDNRQALRLNHAPYSIVSYVWGLKYQQSNQWAIETMAQAIAPSIQNREQAQTWLRVQGYEPSVLNIGPFTRLGAWVGSANVAFDDHPDAKRYADRIETVTVDSIFRWMVRSGLGERPVVLRLMPVQVQLEPLPTESER